MKIYKKILILIVLAWLTSIITINNIGKKLNVSLLKYVNIESKRIVNNIVTYTINETIANNSTDDLFEITKNTRGEIELLDYNTKEVNKILKIINQSIIEKLKSLEEGNVNDFYIAEQLKRGKFKSIKSGIICEVPIGSSKNNVLYANFGPYIPIKMSFLGSVNSYITTKIDSYGFNSVYIEVTLNIEVEEMISLPTSSNVSTITLKSPLTMKIIQGIIPEYYYTKGLEKISNQYSTNE